MVLFASMWTNKHVSDADEHQQRFDVEYCFNIVDCCGSRILVVVGVCVCAMLRVDSNCRKVHSDYAYCARSCMGSCVLLSQTIEGFAARDSVVDGRWA